MDIRIKTNGIEMTPELSAYLDEKIRSLEKFVQGDESARCEVELGKDAGGQRHGDNMWFAEIYIVQSGAPSVRATNRAATLNEAIHDAKEEAARQLQKDKSRRSSLTRRAGAKVKEWLRFGGNV